MDLEDYQEKLRALDRTLSELQARQADNNSDAVEAVRLEQEIEALYSKRRQLLAERTAALGGARHNDATPSISQGFNTVLQDYLLLGELRLLIKKHIPGIYVRVHPQTTFAWDGVAFVHGGFYQGGLFKFRLLIPSTYPDTTSPRVFFQNSLFHPRVNELTGELDLHNQYPQWNPQTDRLWHIIKYIYNMFFHIDVEHPVNEGAASLYSVSKESFEMAARRCAQASQLSELSRTGNSIVMESWSSEYVKVKEAMLHYQEMRKNRRHTSSASSTSEDDDPQRALASHAAELVIAQSQIKTDEQPVKLKPFLRQTLGNTSKAPDVRLGDNACAGYITLHSSNAVIERRYMLLDLTANNLRVFNNEREERQLYDLNPKDICNCYQPDNPDEKSQHIFVIVTPNLTLKCGAMSADGLQMWLAAIIRAMDV